MAAQIRTEKIQIHFSYEGYTENEVAELNDLAEELDINGYSQAFNVVFPDIPVRGRWYIAKGSFKSAKV